MGYEHDSDTRWRAQELYCVDRLAFTRIAELLNVADSTLRRWADTYHWRERREEIAQAESEIRVDTIRGRSHVLKRLLEAEDGKAASQLAFAVASLETLALQQQKAVLAGEISSPTNLEQAVTVTTRAEAITALKQAVNQKINTALTSAKYVTSDSVTDIARCLALVQDLEASVPQENADTAKNAGLSELLAARLDQALGLKE